MEDQISIIYVKDSSLEQGQQNIVSEEVNEKIVEKRSYLNAMYIFVIVGSCTLLTSVVTIIPRHNSILYPTYWYEPMIMMSMTFLVKGTANVMLDCVIYFKAKFFFSLRNYLSLLSYNVLLYATLYTACYLIWVIYMRNNNPMPFIGYCGFGVWVFSFIQIWILFPSPIRKERSFPRKMLAYMMFSLWFLVMSIQISGITIAVGMLSRNLQWTICIVIPLIRGINSKILSHLMLKITETDNEIAKFTLNIEVISMFTFYIAVTLTNSDEMTVFSLLAVELLLHIRKCYHIIKCNKKVDIEDNQVKDNLKQRTLDNLVLLEVIDVLVPIVYAIGFATAFYGPNSTIIGDVKNGYWNYKEVNDPHKMFTRLFQMFSIDLLSIICTTAVLWIFCKINFFLELCKVLKKYWFIMAMKIAVNAQVFYLMKDINLGMDATLGFEWLHEEGRKQLILRTPGLDDAEREILLNKNVAVI